MRDRIHHWKRPAFIAGLCLACLPSYSQFGAEGGGGRKVIRCGGVVAGYLADPIGSPTDAMADAQAAVPQGLLTLEGNPAHAAMIGKWEAAYSDPTVDRAPETFSLKTGYSLPGIGAAALGVRMSNLEISGQGWSPSVTIGHQFASWLAAGVSMKGVWIDLCDAHIRGAAWDAGILILPNLFSRTGKPEDGFKMGASLINQKFGKVTKRETESFKGSGYGSFDSVDFPSVLRIGLSVVPVASESNRLTLAFDAVHPIDGYESYNFGAEERIRVRRLMGIAVRTGLRSRSYGNAMTAGLGLYWSSIRNSMRCEAGYSWMEESFAPDRHGFYLRLYR